ncbi:desmoplakin [Matsumuraeses phaseoli granulovirus]|uniref:Desmoplakin n=1 Tax=Matsumuraeses phaseoli granulovirus TaxID=2760664 RepID=A0AAE7MLI9_9BBAC|nr:desmoplakin [Matsumuraeses phaseoli granulovirus]QOD40063.1 desmoplakin [Matsumuraeses phaseoli granulovirus]
MILTRYRGVDVTPHTFNNLIKTISSNRCVTDNSASKTNFEERIREIILAFNPRYRIASKDMSTEYLLINTLKVNDKKEITHNYNYNTWEDKKFNSDNYNTHHSNNTSFNNHEDDDDEQEHYQVVMSKLKSMSKSDWDNNKLFDLIKTIGGKQYVKKIKKKYNSYIDNLNKKPHKFNKDNDSSSSHDELSPFVSIKANNENNFIAIKKLLGVKKFNLDMCTSLCGAVKQLLIQWDDNNTGNDTVEKYIYALRCVSDKLKQVTEQQAEYEKLNQKLSNTMSVNEHSTHQLNNKLTSLQKICDDYANTIRYNAMELAKLGAEMGEKDSIIETLQENQKMLSDDHADVTKLLQTVKSEHDQLKRHNEILDNDNTRFLTENTQLTTKLDQLKIELNMEIEKNKMYEQSCHELAHKADQENTYKNRENQTLLVQCNQLQDQINSLINNKQTMVRELEQNRLFIQEMEQRQLMSDKQKQDHDIKLNQLCMQKEQELAVCRGRLVDVENRAREKETNLMHKLNQYMDNNTTLQQKYDELKQELAVKEQDITQNQLTIKQQNIELKKKEIELNNVYNDDLNILDEKNNLLHKYNKLQNEYKQLQDNHEEVKQVYEDKLNVLQEELEQIGNIKEDQIKRKLYVEFEKEKEELKNSLVQKFTNTTPSPSNSNIDDQDNIKRKKTTLISKFIKNDNLAVVLPSGHKQNENANAISKSTNRSQDSKNKLHGIMKRKSAQVLPMKNVSFLNKNTTKDLNNLSN